MEALLKNGLQPIVHGSVSRGDVNEKSDVDVVIPEVVPSYMVEAALEASGFKIVDKIMIQASPKYTVKAHLYLDELTTVTFPLVKLTRKEREFYRFGGEIDVEKLKENVRVLGVDKRLMLIEPTETGHIESSIIGKEVETASRLNISVDIVRERVRILTRRDDIGRTGVYLKYRLLDGEVFEEALKKFASKNPAIRRMLIKREAL